MELGEHHVLVVEDEALVAMDLTDVLQQQGFIARAGAEVAGDERSVCMERGLETQVGALAAAGESGLLRRWISGGKDDAPAGKPPVKGEAGDASPA